MADSISYRSSLSMGTMGSDDDTSFANTSERIPLRNQILNIVKDSPNQTIRPATLSNELGISITDASAELCGLLRVCSKGSSSFHFETLLDGDNTGTQTMVFVFPPDIEQQALQQQRKDDIWATIDSIFKVAIKVLKMLTAFGLIISTVIVSIAGMVALVAALIALSRGGNGGGGDSRAARHAVSRQLHNLFITVRQLLWCYAMFGPVGDNDQDPFLREAAYDTSLVLSLCCGNPGSFWFWMRASHLRQRRRRYDRGWARTRNMTSNDYNYDDTASELEGISLIRRGQWGDSEVLPVPTADEAQQQQHRGLLSVAVEFLFGPTSPSGPSESDKWKLRNAVIIQKSTNNSTNRPISLQELIPYVDSPPSSFDDRTDVVSEGLLIVSHFNGRPANKSSDNKEDISSSSSETNRSTNDNDPSKALFYFPELISESQMATTRYNNNNNNNIFMRTASSLMDGTDKQQSVLFNGLFYINETSSSSSSSNQSGPSRSGGNSLGGSTNLDLPKYLYEERKVFSKLTSKQFFHCLLIAILNFLGVIWFAQSLEIGGILEGSLGKFGAALKWSLIPVLKFYSKLFFVIPAIRLLYILCWNEFCKKRNHRRAYLASLLVVDNDSNNNNSSSNDHQQGVVSTTL